jgi:hypothetical protein
VNAASSNSKLLIARMRAAGNDTTGAVRALHEIIIARTVMMDSMPKDERPASGHA